MGSRWENKGSDHYRTGGVEPVDLLNAGDMLRDFALGNIIKYAFRNRRNLGRPVNASDMKKIRHYAEMLIDDKEADQGQEIVYLACPYTHPDPKIVKQRVRLATKICADLVALGHIVFSPLTMTHHLLPYMTDPGHDFWIRFDLAILARCDRLMVLKLDGWDRSVGVQRETEEAKRLGIPIEYLEI